MTAPVFDSNFIKSSIIFYQTSSKVSALCNLEQNIVVQNTHHADVVCAVTSVKDGLTAGSVSNL